MIGYLQGKVVAEKRDEIWLNVMGVGYRVKVKQNKEYRIENSDEVELFIHTAVREDAITLYGFTTMEELSLFEMLIEVSGVGPKTAMEIVGVAKAAEIEAAVREADVAFFAGIKGIGKKSAQRIIIDLKNKIGSLKEVDLGEEDEEDVVFAALKQFGFKPAEIREVMKKMDRKLSEQEQIREGLKLLGKVRV